MKQPRRVLGALGAISLGLILVSTGLVKVNDLETFVYQVQLEKLDVGLPAQAIALVIVILEITLGLALLLGLRHRWVFVPISVLVSFFLLVGARNYWFTLTGFSDGADYCGCLASIVSRSPGEAFWQDLLILVPLCSLILWRFNSDGTHIPRQRVGAVAVISLGLVMMAWPQSPNLPEPREYEYPTGEFLEGDYILTLDGTAIPDAKTFFSWRSSPTLLVVTSHFGSPIRLNPRVMEFDLLKKEQFIRREDGSISIQDGATPQPGGNLKFVEGDKLSFLIGGKRAVLSQKPYLLQLQNSQQLIDYHAEYRDRASLYRPSDEALQRLRAVKVETLVRIYFGSWCPRCKTTVPLLIAAEEYLGTSTIKFEYYGLPRIPTNDLEAVLRGIIEREMPVAVVYVAGVEKGRVEGAGWVAPEVTLANILDQEAVD